MAVLDVVLIHHATTKFKMIGDAFYDGGANGKAAWASSRLIGKCAISLDHLVGMGTSKNMDARRHADIHGWAARALDEHLPKCEHASTRDYMRARTQGS